MHVTIFFRYPRPEYNSIEEVFETVCQAFPKDITVTRKQLPYTGAGLRSIFGNLKYARCHRGNVNHITGDVHYLALATGHNSVLTVHDCNSALQGSFIRKLFIKILWFWLPAMIVRRITTISPKSAEELKEIVPFSKNKIRVVPNPYNPRVNVAGNLRTPDVGNRAVVLIVGTKANKNQERTIEALDSKRIKLLIIGRLTERQKRLLEERKFEYDTHFNIPYSKVAELYYQSDLVCFASLYEGFGMPILEAQLSDRPVITSDIDPLRWVAGAGACLVDPYRIDSIRDGVNKVLGDSSYRDDLVRKGRENVSRFQPNEVARMYLKVYEELGAVRGKGTPRD